MKMRKLKIKDKGLFWIGIITIASSNLVYFFEFSQISASESAQYYLSKTLVNFLIFVACLGLIFRPEVIFWQYVYSLASYGYMIQGSFFRPDYEFSYIQFLIAQSLFFRQSRKGFLIVHSLGTLLFLSSLYVNLEINLQRKVNDLHFSNSASILIICFMIGLAVFTQLTKAREEKNKAQSKFLLVGKQAVNIIHDLKSLSSAPQIYLEMLFNSQTNIDPSTEKILRNLHFDLSNMVKKTKDLYSMIQNPELSTETESVTATLNRVLGFMKTRLTGVELKIEGHSNNSVPKGILELIFLNLIYNSLEAFKKAKLAEPKIFIELTNEKITYLDNAGGAIDSVISNFNSHHFESNEGLGLYLISDAARSFNLNVKLANKIIGMHKGLEVSISF